jgi:thiol-disulfide isomerase/thioredoxin
MKFVYFLLFLLLTLEFTAQNVKCSIQELSGQVVKLGTFQGLKSKTLDSTKADANGNISFNIKLDKPAIGYLITADSKPFFLILDKGEDIELVGESLSYQESIKVLKGKQNQLFAIYAKEHPRREQALSAWGYLQKIYVLDSLFSIQKTPKTAIEEELIRIKKEDLNFLKNIDPKSYVSWYLPTRKLVSDVSTIAQYRAEEIPATIAAFRALDYSDERLYRSGLLKDAVESHFWLLENSGKSLDSVFIEMRTSIDAMFEKLIKDEKKLNEITDFIFDLLERHSLFQASEYLALKVLNEVSCTIDNNLSKQLETYRAMKKGNTAPDFSFYPATIFPADLQKPKKLSDLKTPYTLMVFGASTCPKCQEEIPEIAQLYSKWKAQGVEVVFISLDENPQEFQQFVSALPFISSCDFKKWQSPIAEAYYVFGTPTVFLLDNKREILLRPNSVKQMDAWVDWFLIQGNKNK